MITSYILESEFILKRKKEAEPPGQDACTLLKMKRVVLKGDSNHGGVFGAR